MKNKLIAGLTGAVLTLAIPAATAHATAGAYIGKHGSGQVSAESGSLVTLQFAVLDSAYQPAVGATVYGADENHIGFFVSNGQHVQSTTATTDASGIATFTVSADPANGEGALFAAHLEGPGMACPATNGLLCPLDRIYVMFYAKYVDPTPTTTATSAEPYAVSMALSTNLVLGTAKVRATVTASPNEPDAPWEPAVIYYYQRTSTGDKYLGKSTTNSYNKATKEFTFPAGAHVTIAARAVDNNYKYPYTAHAIIVAKKYASCSSLNANYPHGIARYATSRDKTSATAATGFKVNSTLYLLNTPLDTDKDTVACEKR